MDDTRTTLLAFSACTAAVWQWLGPYGPLLTILLAANILDYVSGILLASNGGKLSSRIGIKGVLKKVGYWFLIATTVGIEYLMTTVSPLTGIPVEVFHMLTTTVAIWLCVNEAISILENLGGLGVPLPDFLKNAVAQLKRTMDGSSETKEAQPDDKETQEDEHSDNVNESEHIQ